MSLPPDPRLKNPSTYNREQIIAAVTDFYQFLTTLPFVEPDDILHPPPEGWPQITTDRSLMASTIRCVLSRGPCRLRVKELRAAQERGQRLARICRPENRMEIKAKPFLQGPGSVRIASPPSWYRGGRLMTTRTVWSTLTDADKDLWLNGSTEASLVIFLKWSKLSRNRAKGTVMGRPLTEAQRNEREPSDWITLEKAYNENNDIAFIESREQSHNCELEHPDQGPNAPKPSKSKGVKRQASQELIYNRHPSISGVWGPKW
ncbi:hypothetical protein CDV55_103534 [Aspergillus turcosus]|nr:hypothetical protein CDV55_103534 [Aspergillus turcosus]